MPDLTAPPPWRCLDCGDQNILDALSHACGADECACSHHRDSHSGGSEVLGKCWASGCTCEGDALW